MRRRSLGQAIFVELETGHQDHPVFVECPFLLFLQDIEVLRNQIQSQDQAAEVSDSSNQFCVIADMVSHTKDIKTPLTIKIDQLRNGQFAVRIDRMGM